MASNSNDSNNDELKCEFFVKEGRYKVSPLSTSYSYPKSTYQTNNHSHPVKVSMVTSNCEGGLYGRLVYNYGRELFTFAYKETARQVYLVCICFILDALLFMIFSCRHATFLSLPLIFSICNKHFPNSPCFFAKICIQYSSS